MIYITFDGDDLLLESMPKSVMQQRSYKYRCLEPACSNITLIDSKWHCHLQKVHPNVDPNEVKYVKVEYRMGSNAPWQMMPLGSELWNNSFLVTNFDQSENGDQESNTNESSPQNGQDGSYNRSVFLGDYNGDGENSPLSAENVSNSKNDAIFSEISKIEMNSSTGNFVKSLLGQSIKSESAHHIEPNDPYQLTQQKITASAISLQLKLGPMQPSPAEFQYPKTHRPTSDSLLCFNPTWFERKLADGSSQPRPWLSYSKCLNKAFCIYCILFGNSAKVSESWTKTGWDTWNNGSRDIKRHEESPQHRAAELAKVKAMSGFHSQHNSLFQVSANSEVIENRKMVKSIIDFIKLSASLQIEGEQLSHSFTKIVQLVGQYDGSLGLAIDKLRSMSDQELNFVSIPNQRRLASAISETIAERLVLLAKKRRSYTLVLDVVHAQGLDDKSSHRLAVWVRYLTGDNAGETKVAQSLLEVICLTGNEGLEEKVMRLLRKFGLDPANMVTFCCHSPGSEIYLGQLGPVRGWPHNDDILAFLLEAGCAECTRLSSCLGLVQQLTLFWVGSSARDRFLCEFLERQPGSLTATKLDEMLDLLVDRYAEMIDALAELRATTSLSPLDAWIADSLWKSLKASETEEGIQLLRKAVGLLRPALSCQQLGKVHFLHQMRVRMQAEMEQFETILSNQTTGSPPSKLFRPDINNARPLGSREEYRSFMANIYRIVSDSYSDLHLQLLSEIIHFSGSSLDDCSYSSSVINEQSITTVCQLAKVDPRSVLREMVDFQPIYKEHKAAVLDFSTTANIPVFPGHQTSSKSMEIHLDPFLTPLKLVTEFTSFPSLLTVYKMLAVLPIFSKPSWQTQRLRVQNCLKSFQNLDEFNHCSLMLVSVEDQQDESLYLPVDMVIDKLATCSATLRKALSLPR